MIERSVSWFEAALNKAASALIEVSSLAVTWPRWVKRSLVMAGDAMLAVFAVWLAFSLRLGEWRLLDWSVIRFAGSLLLIWFPVAVWQGVYAAIFRYTGRGTIVTLAAAVAIVCVPLVYFYMIRSYPGVPRTIALLAPMIFFAMMATARIVGRYVLVDLFHSQPAVGSERHRSLIYGAGSLGQRLAASLAAERGMQLVGYLDDDPSKKGRRLDGHRIWHSDDIDMVIERTGATRILLAMSDISRSRKQEIVDRLSGHPVKVHPLPPMRALLDGTLRFDDLQSIEVDDLLGRSPVAPLYDLLSSAVSGKRVMVTGAGGSIGSEIARQIVDLVPSEIVLVDANEFALFQIEKEIEAKVAALDTDQRPTIDCRLVNLTDRSDVERLFARHRPQTIYHAAAYKHVPMIESNIVAGVRNNVFGTINTARAAQHNGAEKFILISTDKAVRPPNVMGASKRVCEMALQAFDSAGSDTVFAMVRFGNVLGSSGSVVPLFRQQIERGGPITVTHRDVIRYFMTIPEAAQLVLQAGGMAEGGEVFLLDMGEPVKIWNLARSMITLAGLTIRDESNPDGDIEIVATGLRPGEKLYEELLIGESALPTRHPRIMRAREQFLGIAELEPHLDALEAAVINGDEGGCRANLSALVPTLPPAGASLDAAESGCQRPGGPANHLPGRTIAANGTG